MAMDGDSLASEIKAAYEALSPPSAASLDLDYFKALANAIVDHIKNNAVVTTTSGAPDGEHTGNVT